MGMEGAGRTGDVILPGRGPSSNSVQLPMLTRIHGGALHERSHDILNNATAFA
jgi:hypothetical protein